MVAKHYATVAKNYGGSLNPVFPGENSHRKSPQISIYCGDSKLLRPSAFSTAASFGYRCRLRLYHLRQHDFIEMFILEDFISFGYRFERGSTADTDSRPTESKNEKEAQRVSFGAGYPADVHADIQADVRGAN